MNFNQTTGQFSTTQNLNFGNNFQKISVDADSLRLRIANTAGDIHTFLLDGSLDIIPGSTVTTTRGAVIKMVQHGSKYLMLNTEDQAIDRYAIQGDGSLLYEFSTAVPGSGIKDMAIHPNGNYAYVINEGSSTVAAYSINGAGDLSLIDTYATSAGPVSIVVASVECTCQLFGDIVDVNGQPAPDCLVDVTDLLCILDDFTDPGLCPGDGDLITSGGGCSPDGTIDVDDLLTELAAFSGDYACSHPCGP